MSYYKIIAGFVLVLLLVSYIALAIFISEELRFIYLEESTEYQLIKARVFPVLLLLAGVAIYGIVESGMYNVNGGDGVSSVIRFLVALLSLAFAGATAWFVWRVWMRDNMYSSLFRVFSNFWLAYSFIAGLIVPANVRELRRRSVTRPKGAAVPPSPPTMRTSKH